MAAQTLVEYAAENFVATAPPAATKVAQLTVYQSKVGQKLVWIAAVKTLGGGMVIHTELRAASNEADAHAAANALYVVA